MSKDNSTGSVILPQKEIEHYLKINTPKGFGLCEHDYEHFAELFIRMHQENKVPKELLNAANKKEKVQRAGLQ